MNSSIQFIKKDGEGTYETPEVVQRFLEAQSLEEIRPYVERARERLYATWASVDARDKDGERIPIEDVIAQQDKLLARNGPVTDMHTNRHVGETIAYKVLEHPKTKTIGVLHLNRIWGGELANPLDDQVWGETQSGERTGSSVGGFNEGRRYVREDNGMITTVLDGFHQYETANVYRGANPFATNEAVSIVAKSADNVQGNVAVRDTLFSELAKKDGAITREEFEKFWTEAHETAFKASGLFTALAKSADLEAKPESEETLKTAQTNEDNTEPLPEPEGELMNTEETTKKFDELTKSFDERIAALSLSITKSHEELSKSLTELSKSLVKKEEAAIEGSASAPSPAEPKPEASNQEEVYKAVEAAVAKALAERLPATPVTKSTPRPGAGAPANSVSKTAVDIAMGRTKATWNDVHKMAHEANEASQAKIQEQLRAMRQ